MGTTPGHAGYPAGLHRYRERMDQHTVLPLLPAGLGRVQVVPRTGSTSADLVAAAADEDAWPDRSVLVADHQVAGRGRAGRTWVTEPGTAVTFSVLLRPRVPVDRFGWVPLLGGLAVVRALGRLEVAAALKWPNDVLVAPPGADEVDGWGRWRKVAGVLGDLVPGSSAAVVGIGVNVTGPAPVPHAASLAELGVDVDRSRLLAAVVRELVDLDDRWRAARGDAVAADLADEVVEVCLTVGGDVRVHRPDGELEGRAIGLADDGALLVLGSDGTEHTVLAGDVLLR